jgi:hypothetical protein
MAARDARGTVRARARVRACACVHGALVLDVDVLQELLEKALPHLRRQRGVAGAVEGLAHVRLHTLRAVWCTGVGGKACDTRAAHSTPGMHGGRAGGLRGLAAARRTSAEPSAPFIPCIKLDTALRPGEHARALAT